LAEWHDLVLQEYQEMKMIKGLRTVKYPVSDLDKAKAWFAEVFGTGPYFDQPFYVGFAIGGFELGLVPDGTPGTAGSVVYWGVDDIDAEFARILALGATEHEAIQDVGEGIRVAELKDPFGNVLGLIYNPLFDPAAVL
jgi:predicted enzyme related to lactoylglutathione lyase